MTAFTDPDHLKREQYNSIDKLSARIRLHERFTVMRKDIHRWFFDHLLERVAARPAQILEIGCGRGDIWQKNADRTPPEWDITLTDFSDGMLSGCRDFLGSALAGRFQYDVVDVQGIPYEDARFAVVIANMMLYHVPDRAKAIAELRRVLKPDGILFAMTNGDRHMRDLYLLAHQFDTSTTLSQDDYGRIFSTTFSLENGGDQLRAQFARVEVIRFESHLYVTELQPLLDYVASMIGQPYDSIFSQHGQAITAELQRRIDSDGGITIEKDTGMFIASGYAG